MKRSSTPARRRLLLHEKRLSKSGYKRIAGVDEAGRGPLAGPVVAGAVILKSTSFRSRIDDSKKLSASQREKAYREIVRKAHIGVGVVDEKTIDEINIYRSTVKAMQLALADLRKDPDYVIVDGRVSLAAQCPVQAIVRGDAASLSIAAASIVAKVTRDRIMADYDKAYPHYGFARHKGYPTRSHRSALRVHGPSPIHRRSFAPVRETAGSPS